MKPVKFILTLHPMKVDKENRRNTTYGDAVVTHEFISLNAYARDEPVAAREFIIKAQPVCGIDADDFMFAIGAGFGTLIWEHDDIDAKKQGRSYVSTALTGDQWAVRWEMEDAQS